MVGVYFASDVQKIDEGDGYEQDAEQGQADPDDGGIMEGDGRGIDLFEVQFSEEEAEAGDDEAEGDGGEASANPGQKGTLVGEMVGDAFAYLFFRVLWWLRLRFRGCAGYLVRLGHRWVPPVFENSKIQRYAYI